MSFKLYSRVRSEWRLKGGKRVKEVIELILSYCTKICYEVLNNAMLINVARFLAKILGFPTYKILHELHMILGGYYLQTCNAETL